MLPAWRSNGGSGVRTLCCRAGRRIHQRLTRPGVLTTSPVRLAAVPPAHVLGPPRALRLTHTDVEQEYFSPRIPAPRPPGLEKKDLLALVESGGDESVEEHLSFFRDPYLRGYAPADGPDLVVSNKRDDMQFPSQDELPELDDTAEQTLKRLRAAVLRRLRYRPDVDPEYIYQLYLKLPEPRMRHLHYRLRHNFLRVFGVAERTSKSMLRYFALLAEVKNSGLRLSRGEWNAAMSFASRYVGRSTETEAESALNLWREMERDAGVEANAVTFSILFDVASKAGNFTLAEMLYKEMERRGLPFNRYHHVSLIHYFGLKMDSDGVRAAYREMVEAGEIIDTVVLNCVMSGLLRCGEEDAAERVYRRMKASHAGAAKLPEKDYFKKTVVTKALMMLSRVGKQHPHLRAQFQAASPLVPDLQTYRILINHFAVKLGDLNRVTRYLDEMKYFQVPLSGAVFLALFKGFGLYGGYAASDWSEQRLAGVWSAFLRALDNGAPGLYIDTWMVMWALRAFDKCSSRETVLEAYDALSSRWDPQQMNAEFASDFLYKLLKRA